MTQEELIRRAKMTFAAQRDPYGSVEKVFPLAIDRCGEDNFSGYLGVKNMAPMPQRAVEALTGAGFALHTLDRASWGGRAVDMKLQNPITGHPMTGSSSGTAVNVRLRFNDLGLGTDGGGSVLAPAMSVNLYGFISPLICAQEMSRHSGRSTDGIPFHGSLGLMARDWETLLRGITVLPGLEGITPSPSPAKVFRIEGDCVTDETGRSVCPVPDRWGAREPLIRFLEELLPQCDCLVSDEGPVDVNGIGDSVFGHFDPDTAASQARSGKGLIRVANMVGATALCVPAPELGRGRVFLCQSQPEKIEKLLSSAGEAAQPEDPMLAWYFSKLDQYLKPGALPFQM
ncbi:MAG: hypothetical protein HFF07_05400 [Oscillospiraceae bacterium]|nr:hypothetical protein [Oscillospiraceae bacterium]